jgi:hypothetical protein
VSPVTAGFGDALTAALDVMAFAHDFDLSTATEGIPSNIDARQARTKTDQQHARTTPNNPEAATTTTTTTTSLQPVQTEETRLSVLTDLIDRPVNVEATKPRNVNRKCGQS